MVKALWFPCPQADRMERVGNAMNLGLSAGATGGIIVGVIGVLKN